MRRGRHPRADHGPAGGEADAAAVAEQLHRAFGSGQQGRTAAAETFWAARRFLEALARCRPVLVVFEDLHWAEPTFLDLVESLTLPRGRSAIVLFCLARPELLDQRPAWAAEAESSVSVQLEPLADGPAATLLDSLAAGYAIAPSTRARLIDTAAGNPFYLEQLAVALSEQAGSDGWPVLPPTIQALLSARLQRLGPAASSVLVRAAIVGQDFGEREVSELLPPEARGPLGRNLQTLVARGLLQPGPGPSPDEAYSFRHILIQEAAYRSIPKSLRADLHSRYADWLEGLAPGPLLARSEILGYHLEQSVRYRNELRPAGPESAALAQRAARHLETAGYAAHDRGDDLAAVNLLDRAAALLPADAPVLGRLQTSLGTALIEAGQFERAMTVFDEAQRITAMSADERQQAHARVETLVLRLRMSPDEAEMEIAQALPGLRPQFWPARTIWGSAGSCSWKPPCTGTTPGRAPPSTPGCAPPTTPARSTTAGSWPISSAGSPRPRYGARHPPRRECSDARITWKRSANTPSAGPRSS